MTDLPEHPARRRQHWKQQIQEHARDPEWLLAFLKRQEAEEYSAHSVERRTKARLIAKWAEQFDDRLLDGITAQQRTDGMGGGRTEVFEFLLAHPELTPAQTTRVLLRVLEEGNWKQAQKAMLVAARRHTLEPKEALLDKLYENTQGEWAGKMLDFFHDKRPSREELGQKVIQMWARQENWGVVRGTGSKKFKNGADSGGVAMAKHPQTSPRALLEAAREYPNHRLFGQIAHEACENDRREYLEHPELRQCYREGETRAQRLMYNTASQTSSGHNKQFVQWPTLLRVLFVRLTALLQVPDQQDFYPTLQKLLDQPGGGRYLARRLPDFTDRSGFKALTSSQRAQLLSEVSSSQLRRELIRVFQEAPGQTAPQSTRRPSDRQQ